MPDPGIAAVAQLLSAHGVHADVTLAGHARDVVAISAPPDCFAQVRALSGAIRALGFRYVTLEMTTSEDS